MKTRFKNAYKIYFNWIIINCVQFRSETMERGACIFKVLSISQKEGFQSKKCVQNLIRRNENTTSLYFGWGACTRRKNTYKIKYNWKLFDRVYFQSEIQIEKWDSMSQSFDWVQEKVRTQNESVSIKFERFNRTIVWDLLSSEILIREGARGASNILFLRSQVCSPTSSNFSRSINRIWCSIHHPYSYN